MSERKPITIRFRYNKESGEIEDLIVDDNSPNAPEDFHDQVAELIAQQLGSNAVIQEAGVVYESQNHESQNHGSANDSVAHDSVIPEEQL